MFLGVIILLQKATDYLTTTHNTSHGILWYPFELFVGQESPSNPPNNIEYWHNPWLSIRNQRSDYS